MKPAIKKILNITGWFSAFLLLVVLFGFSKSRQKVQPYNGLKISIDRSNNNYFILEDDVKSTLKNLGFALSDSDYASQVDVRKIEDFLSDNPFVQKANVFTTINGVLKVEISQRKPLLRVFNQKGESFYLDQFGKIMPLSTSYSARVLVVNGAVSVDYYTLYKLSKNQEWNIDKFINQHLKQKSKSHNLSSSQLDSMKMIDQYLDLYKMATFISNDEFWNAQVSQLYVNQENEFEVIPRVGNHEIIFGEADNIPFKFEKLMVFYKKALPKTGWNEYSTINLKFKNQIVCTKI